MAPIGGAPDPPKVEKPTCCTSVTTGTIQFKLSYQKGIYPQSLSFKKFPTFDPPMGAQMGGFDFGLGALQGVRGMTGQRD